MRVVVIGAGAVGLSAALVSETAGHNVTLIDPKGFVHPMPRGEIGRQVWALGPTARSLLLNLGISFDSERICSYSCMRVIDSGSDALVKFSDNNLGDIVEADWLCSNLLDKVAASSINCRRDPIKSISPQGLIDDPKSQLNRCDLAIFCEGRNGETASASGFEKRDQGYQQYAVVATLGCEIPHYREAFQIFTTEGPLALLPLPDDGISHRVSLVWSVSPAKYSYLSKLSNSVLLKAIEEASEFARGALYFRSEISWVPLSQHDLKSDSRGVCLAIGDTAHGILPLAGLGANLGFADVAALSNTLSNTLNDGYRVARTVPRLRRMNNLAVMKAMAALSSSFESTRPFIRILRSFAFRMVDRHAFINRLIRELAG